MFRIIKVLFYVYVVGLAVYVSLRTTMHQRLGKAQVDLELSQEHCFSTHETWKYCVYQTPMTDKDFVLYFLHGRGGDEKDWNKKSQFTSLLQKYWQENKKRVPMVVSISLGKEWLVTSQMTSSKTGLLEKFQGEIFPAIDQHLGIPKKRFIMGISMGGLNALTLSLNDNQRFQRVAALCPPLVKVSPYSPWMEWFRFLVRTGAKPYAVLTMVKMGRQYFATEKEWFSYSPLEKVRQAHFTGDQKFYLSAGLYDEYGLYEGVEEFVHSMQFAGGLMYWKPNSGKHCSVDIESLGDFLAL